MIKWVVVLLIFVVVTAGGVVVAVEGVKSRLYAKMEENALLRRQVTALEEENKVFQGIFDCFGWSTAPLCAFYYCLY